MSGITIKNGCVIYYGNPAGYVKDEQAVVDTMFQGDELAGWLAGRNLQARWEDGVYDKLAEGGTVAATTEESTEPLKTCRIWQIGPDAPENLRFVPYSTLTSQHDGPDLDNYTVVFDGQVGTNDLEAIYERFHDKLAPGFSRTLAMSDLIELYDMESSSLFYVDKYVLQPCQPGGYTGAEIVQEQGMEMNL